MRMGWHGWWILFALVAMAVGVVALFGIVAWELWRDRRHRGKQA